MFQLKSSFNTPNETYGLKICQDGTILTAEFYNSRAALKVYN